MANGIKLKAENSSGKQILHFVKQMEKNCKWMYYVTLTGNYNDKTLQVDFDGMKRKKLKRIVKRFKKLLKK